MKAKIIKTGEIVDVYHEPQHGQVSNIYKESVFINGRMWQENELEFIDSLQEEPVSEDLGEYVNELSKQFPEVSFAKLSRIAVRVAQWQEEQMMAKAIDATCFALQGAALFSFRLPAGSYLVGSKVKVIVIKEE